MIFQRAKMRLGSYSAFVDVGHVKARHAKR